MKSTALKREADGTILLEKPWTTKADPYINLSRWVTYGTMSLGLIASALYLYFGYRSHPKMPPLCLVLDDNFESLDTATWTREIDLGGFGCVLTYQSVCDSADPSFSNGEFSS